MDVKTLLKYGGRLLKSAKDAARKKKVDKDAHAHLKKGRKVSKTLKRGASKKIKSGGNIKEVQLGDKKDIRSKVLKNQEVSSKLPRATKNYEGKWRGQRRDRAVFRRWKKVGVDDRGRAVLKATYKGKHKNKNTTD